MRGRLLPWAAIGVAALAYPLAVLAGGPPRFPTRAECVHPATNNQQLEAVFGRFTTQIAAEASLRRVLGAGFTGSQLEPDGCGYLKVDVHGIPSLAVGRSLVAEARRVGLHPTLEIATP
jgi:hypothetical protein